ncbi:hypothetical protein CKO28_23385 [Rhodovibrio sodomensis]|uniref:Glycosyl transferase n=2 Tax=Rhodovibrio sodomensis TaxID=1088 RepID=A0ABS1DMK1_9PROT|nr:hypothetical protein [Rhodovibrio sodomensis]
MRVGFLLNHEAPHQVLHAAPVAAGLSRRHGHAVVLLTAGPAVEAVLERVLSLYPDHRCRSIRLAVPTPVRWGAAALKPAVHAGKAARLRLNRDKLAACDAVVTPEKTSLALRDDPALRHLVMIHTRHGAGDRAVGFDARASRFDLVLAAGEKVRERLITEGGVAADRCRVVGYPKFDVAPQLARPTRPFADDRPVVLYNPHYSNRESSWPRWGRRVLDFFRESPAYNLIFAPHPVLYSRPLRHRARPLQRWRGRHGIHVDTGSDACFDMSHVLAADIYLGDVSSQVYEFLWRPRPCVFLDAHDLTGSEPAANLAMWRAGEVVRDIDQLPAALDRARGAPSAYRAEQDALFAATFDHDPDTPAGARAADVIAGFLHR